MAASSMKKAQFVAGEVLEYDEATGTAEATVLDFARSAGAVVRSFVASDDAHTVAAEAAATLALDHIEARARAAAAAALPLPPEQAPPEPAPLDDGLDD